MSRPKGELGLTQDRGPARRKARAADRRRQSEPRKLSERLSLAQETGRLGVFEWDPGTNQVDLTPELEAILDMPSGSFDECCRIWADRLLPEDRLRLIAVGREWLASGRAEAEAELRYRRRDGARWLQLRARASRDPSGRPERVVGTVVDATDRRRVEDELRRSQSALAEAGSLAQLGAWWIDFDDREDLNANPLHWSDEVYRIFGYEPGELPVTNALFFEHVPSEDRPRIARAIALALEERRTYKLEHRIRRKDGEERIVCEHAHVHFDGQGRPLRIIGAVQDITDRKRAEGELRQANERLIETDRRRDEFLAVLSHELRNPLGPIRNSLYILQRTDAATAEHQRALSVIDRQTQQLAGLVEDLLDVTRISRGKTRLHRERLELNELVRRTAEDHRELFTRNGIELAVAVPGQPIAADGDRTRLVQVIGNLLQNAAKFTPRGGHASVALVRRDEYRAAITVEDDGVGIPPEILDRLFEPFEQAEQSLDRTRGGLGVGLFLVRSLVELHGGTVSANSAGLGRGAAFEIQLPVEPGPMSQA